MGILFWQWNAFMQKGMERALKDLNIEYEVYFYQLNDWEKDDIFKEKFRDKLSQHRYHTVLSVNYCPLISELCQKEGIKYVSWVYDAPIHIRDIRSFHNSCNQIYFFDRGQIEKYKKAGYSNIHHLPLAADTEVWEIEKDRKYECDVAFVGRLYKSDYAYLMGPLPEYYRGMMEGIINAQGKVYGAYFLEEIIADSLTKELNVFYLGASKGKWEVKREELEFACACEITGRERQMTLALLAKRYHVHLYSEDDSQKIEGVSNSGYVEYYSEMPSAFKGAKINIIKSNSDRDSVADFGCNELWRIFDY